MCCDCDLSPLADTLGSRLDRHRRRLHREYLKFGTAEAGALHHEHRRSVEQAVQRAQQRVVAGEELVPVVRGCVAGQYHRVGWLVNSIGTSGQQILVPPINCVGTVHKQAGTARVEHRIP